MSFDQNNLKGPFTIKEGVFTLKGVYYEEIPLYSQTHLIYGALNYRKDDDRHSFN
jgi:hypothetical protein